MKRQHPILKMRRTLEKKHYLPRVIWPPQNQAVEADIARHVKPLLDGLEREHEGDMVGCLCSTCRLLAEWRAKL